MLGSWQVYYYRAKRALVRTANQGSQLDNMRWQYEMAVVMILDICITQHTVKIIIMSDKQLVTQ